MDTENDFNQIFVCQFSNYCKSEIWVSAPVCYSVSKAHSKIYEPKWICCSTANDLHKIFVWKLSNYYQTEIWVGAILCYSMCMAHSKIYLDTPVVVDAADGYCKWP